MMEEPICYLGNQFDVEYPFSKSEYTVHFLSFYRIAVLFLFRFSSFFHMTLLKNVAVFDLEWVFQWPTVFMAVINTNLTVRSKMGKIGLDSDGKSL